MSYKLSFGQANTSIVNNIESFLLFFSFKSGNPINVTSFYSAFLAVHDCNQTKGLDKETASPTWSVPNDSKLRIDWNTPPKDEGGFLSWVSGSTSESIQISCGRSHSTLYVSGGTTIPPELRKPVANDWKVAKFVPPAMKDAPYYMKQSVKINQSKMDVHSIIQQNILNDSIYGYVSQLRKGSGIDLLLAEKAGPVFVLEREDLANKKTSLTVPSGFQNGCAFVVAGSFKKYIPLISTFYNRLLISAADSVSRHEFLDFFIDLATRIEIVIDKKDLGLIPTLESCDDPNFLPKDSSSPDSPVEFVLFRI